MASQVSIYLNEADKWKNRQLYWAILEYLHSAKIAGATVFRAYSGFTGRGPLKTGLTGHAPNDLPLVLTFIDSEEQIRKVMPRLIEMAGDRLIVQAPVVVRNGLAGETAAAFK